MAATQQGKVQIYWGEAPPSITFYSSNTTVMIAGYVQPTAESLAIGPIAEQRELVGADGEVNSVRTTRFGLECTITFRPEGTTFDNAQLSAAMPAVGYTAAISGMHVIQIGSFADAWNVTQNSSNSMWHVTSVSQLSGGSQDPATYSVTMRRWAGVLGNTVVADND